MTQIALFFKKAVCIFFGCLFMLVTVGQKVNPIEPLDKEALKLDLAIMSDIHIEGNGFDKFPVVPKCFNAMSGGKEFIDALVINGDNSICAQNIENMLFYGMLNNTNPIRPYFVATGNHDIGNNDDTKGYGYMMEVYDDTLTFRTYDYYLGAFTGTDMTYAIR